MSVLQAALLINGEIWTLPRPARHHILVQAWCNSHWDYNSETQTGKPGRIPQHEQGFITTSGEFISREQAALLAFESEQIIEEKRILFSEDLW